MRVTILSLCNLACLLAIPFFLFQGISVLAEAPLFACLLIFIGFPICVGLAIVFDYVRGKIDSEEMPPELKKIPCSDPRSKKQDYRVSDLSGTPWEKNQNNRN